MKKVIVFVLIAVFTVSMIACTQADRVAHNLAQEADNFNIVRRLTVINCITGDTLFVMEGKMSVEDTGSILRLDVEDGGVYNTHMVGLADNVTYTLEQISSSDVSNHQYTINFNPKMWIPFDFGYVD